MKEGIVNNQAGDNESDEMTSGKQGESVGE